MSASQTLRAEAAKRILIKDGAYGTRSRTGSCRAPNIAADSTC